MVTFLYTLRRTSIVLVCEAEFLSGILDTQPRDGSNRKHRFHRYKYLDCCLLIRFRGTCLPRGCLTMIVHSGFAIPAFRRQVKIPKQRQFEL
jgi:hypothetical protein